MSALRGMLGLNTIISSQSKRILNDLLIFSPVRTLLMARRAIRNIEYILNQLTALDISTISKEIPYHTF